MAIAGPRIVAGQVIGPGGAATDFPVRPTVNGAVLGPLAYTIPTLAATSPTTITSAGVTFSSTNYFQDGNGWGYLGFIASATPSAADNIGTLATFLISAPGRTTSFADTLQVVGNVGSAFDDTNSTVNNVIVRSQASSTNIYVAFLPNSTTSVHSLPITVRYKLI